MALILKQYKFKNGEINFPAIFKVPSTERLPALYEKDFMQATALVVGALTMAFEKMRFRKMDGSTINDIAEEVLNSCDEDNLSLEDLVLFLQNMVRGKYGNLEDMSVSRFMNLFDKNREERCFAIMNFRENEHLQHKGMGYTERSRTVDPMEEHFARMANTMSELRATVKELRDENR
jgi:hypothetical protein